MACDFCAAIIPPGTGPGAPSQWRQENVIVPPHPITLILKHPELHPSILSRSPEVECQDPADKEASTFQKEAGLQEGAAVVEEGQEKGKWDI